MATATQSRVHAEEPGFSISEGADWSKYMEYRPLYPVSFFKRIYQYHNLKPQVSWATAHDVGAGAGIVSAALVSQFDHVVVSDPNEGYTALARKILVDESGNAAAKFTFLQEGAEKSSLEPGSVDLIAACEMIQWTDTDAAVAEFDRQLKAGGTLAVTSYTKPNIVGNARAQECWQSIFAAYSQKTRGLGDLYDRAFRTMNTGLENVAFPETRWEGVNRLYINARGSLQAFQIDDRSSGSRVCEGEEKAWEEGDPDWSDKKGIDWFKAYFGTWVPRIPQSEIQNLWDELDSALDNNSVSIETPVVMIFATKKSSP